MKKISLKLILIMIVVCFGSFNKLDSFQTNTCDTQESKFYKSFDKYALKGIDLLKERPSNYPFVEVLVSNKKEIKYRLHLGTSKIYSYDYLKKNGYWTLIIEGNEGEYESKAYSFIKKNSRRYIEIMYTEYGTELVAFMINKRGEQQEEYVFEPFVVDETKLHTITKEDLPTCYSKEITDIVIQKNKFRYYELMTNCKTGEVINEVEEIYTSDQDIDPFWALFLLDQYEKVKLK